MDEVVMLRSGLTQCEMCILGVWDSGFGVPTPIPFFVFFFFCFFFWVVCFVRVRGFFFFGVV